MVAWDGAATGRRLKYWRLQRFGQPQQFVRCAGPVHTGPSNDGWSTGARQPLRRPLHQRRVHLRMYRGFRTRDGEVTRGVEHVLRKFEKSRAGAAALDSSQTLGHGGRDTIELMHAFVMTSYIAERSTLIGQFVNHATLGVDQVRIELRGKVKDWRGLAPGLGDGGEGVGGAGTGRRDKDAGLASSPSIAIGGETGPL